MPTIRVDDQVWEWLLRQGRLFAETPNAVLRRVAELDTPPPNATSLPNSPANQVRDRPRPRHEVRTVPLAAMPETPLGARVTGDSLNRRHRLALRHVLYHKDGTWFERLVRFPGGLCDSHGYVRFDTEQQFLHDPRLSVGRKVNVRDSISTHPRYCRFGAE